MLTGSPCATGGNGSDDGPDEHAAIDNAHATASTAAHSKRLMRPCDRPPGLLLLLTAAMLELTS